MSKTWIVIIAILVIVVIYGWSIYNKLVTTNLAADTQWAQVEAVYQRRFDLIPNLVNSVKGIFKQEQKIFGDLAAARTQYAGAKTADQKASAASQVESALGRLLVIVENYPQLKSSEAVQSLMAQLEGTENRISVERQRFNNTIQSYNLTVKRFPSSVIAGIFGFKERSFFKSVSGAENAPSVNF